MSGIDPKSTPLAPRPRVRGASSLAVVAGTGGNRGQELPPSADSRTSHAASSPAEWYGLRPYVQIARVDHWFKNVFVLPGIVVALGTDPGVDRAGIGWRILIGLLSICLIASSNYTLNELIDAPFDRHHPTKHRRPVPAGHVSVSLGYAQWIALMVAGIALARQISVPFMLSVLALCFVLAVVYLVR